MIFICASIFSALTGFSQREKISSEAFSSVDMNLSIKAEDIQINEKKAFANNQNLTAEDFIGKYVWKGYGPTYHYIGFSEENIWHNGGSLSIIKDPDNDGLLIIKGFDKYGDLKGCYVENNRLYIPNQLVGYDEDYEADIWFHNAAYKNSRLNPNSYELNPNTECLFYFMMTEDHELISRSLDVDIDMLNSYSYTDEEIEDLMCAAIDATLYEKWFPSIIVKNQYWECTLIEAVPIESYFTFNEDEWISVGNTEFKDPWLNWVWENDNASSYKVSLYRDKSNKYRFLLKDPYGSNTPYGDTKYIHKDKEGYIIFNIEDPEHVYFEPYIYGCTLTKESLDYPDSFAFYPYNTEGLYTYSWGHSLTYLKIKNSIPSTFSEGNRTVNINNACYSIGDENIVKDHCFWDDYKMHGYIILPNTYDGVNEILEDNANYPKEYFNLQGVRLENPRKGQVVIMRQGNLITKEIVR